MSVTPIAIFASGRGSNFGAILQAVQKGELDARIVALVCDKPQAAVVEAARAAGIPVLVVPVDSSIKGAMATQAAQLRETHEKEILKALKPLSPHFLVMAGYMRIITRHLIEEFRSKKGYSRIVNVHPSLLPAFPGKDAYAQAWKFGAKVTGVTVHLVAEDVDSGPICAQEAFSIADCKSATEVEQRGLAIEHRLYPQTLKWVLKEEFEFKSQGQEGRHCVCPH